MPSPQPVTMQTWRGVPCLDFNMLLLFAHAPLDAATGAFTEVFETKSWTKDVMERKVKAAAPAYLAYQFSGHPWTIFDLITPTSPGPQLKTGDAEMFAKALEDRAMLMSVSDTGGYYEYALFDPAGKLLQRYCDSTGDFEFESADKKVKTPKRGDLMKHWDAFMRAQDVLVPPFGSMSSSLSIPPLATKPFDVRIEEEEEFSAENIPRVDLICLA